MERYSSIQLFFNKVDSFNIKYKVVKKLIWCETVREILEKNLVQPRCFRIKV